MDKETYIKILKENPKINYREIIERFECENCKRCKNKKLINTCCLALELARSMW
jgi:hypothetical protein